MIKMEEEKSKARFFLKCAAMVGFVSGVLFSNVSKRPHKKNSLKGLSMLMYIISFMNTIVKVGPHLRRVIGTSL